MRMNEALDEMKAGMSLPDILDEYDGDMDKWICDLGELVQDKIHESAAAFNMFGFETIQLDYDDMRYLLHAANCGVHAIQGIQNGTLVQRSYAGQRPATFLNIAL